MKSSIINTPNDTKFELMPFVEALIDTFFDSVWEDSCVNFPDVMCDTCPIKAFKNAKGIKNYDCRDTVYKYQLEIEQYILDHFNEFVISPKN